MFRKLPALLMALTLFGFGAQSANAGPKNNKDRVLTVMTRNMDAGSDFWYVLTANPNDPFSILVAITQTFQEIHASNIPARADGISAEIEATDPDLVGLQEVTTLSAGPDAAHMSLVDDALQSLRAALAQRGLHYDAIVIQKNADITLPAFDQAFNLITVGLTDFDVVLARSDLPVSEFKLENIQKGYFTHILQLGVAGVDIPFTRGWIALDAKLRGKQYRFCNHAPRDFRGRHPGAASRRITRRAPGFGPAGDFGWRPELGCGCSQLFTWSCFWHPGERRLSGRLEQPASRRPGLYLAVVSRGCPGGSPCGAAEDRPGVDARRPYVRPQ